MTQRLVRQLSKALDGGKPCRLITGTVSSVGAGGVTVSVRGSTLEDLSYVGAAPSNGDVVALLFYDRQYLVLGTIN